MNVGENSAAAAATNGSSEQTEDQVVSDVVKSVTMTVAREIDGDEAVSNDAPAESQLEPAKKTATEADDNCEVGIIRKY